MSKNLVVVSAGTSDPSSTRMLADRVAARVVALASEQGEQVGIRVIDLREIAHEVTTALVSQHVGPGLQAAIDALRDADGVIASTPVYKAGASGLFLSFFQSFDNDLLIGKPVVLAATAGTARHALVADDQLRGLFGYSRAMTVPTALFAAPEDWSDPALTSRIDRAADGGNEQAKALSSYWVGQGVGLVDGIRSATAVVQEFKQDFADAIENLMSSIES